MSRVRDEQTHRDIANAKVHQQKRTEESCWIDLISTDIASTHSSRLGLSMVVSWLCRMTISVVSFWDIAVNRAIIPSSLNLIGFPSFLRGE